MGGYSPIGFVRCGRSACKMTELKFKVGKETGGKKLESPHSLKSNEVALVTFEPQQPMIVDSFKSCEGLSRIAFLDGNTAVMLGKVTKTYPLPRRRRGRGGGDPLHRIFTTTILRGRTARFSEVITGR